jgi:hypothetical protein
MDFPEDLSDEEEDNNPAVQPNLRYVDKVTYRETAVPVDKSTTITVLSIALMSPVTHKIIIQ